MQKFKKRKETRVSINNYLPHNFLAEKIILSSLLISTEAIETTLRKITIETFYFNNHQEIYRAIIFLYQERNSVDILTLITFSEKSLLLQAYSNAISCYFFVGWDPVLHLEYKKCVLTASIFGY